MTFAFLGADWKNERLLLGALLFAGAALRLWQYVAHSSLWLDEAALARNIIERSVRELLSPLDHGQVAPVGFLLVQKLVVGVAGGSEYALRLVPLLCGIASLFVFTLVARRVLSGSAATYAVALMALGQPFIYFSAQVKQYAPDVAASLAALLLVLKVSEGVTSQRRAWLAAFGAVLPWFSTPTALVLVGAAGGAAMTAAWRRDPAALRLALSLLALWALSSGIAGLFAMRAVPADMRNYLNWFWNPGYAPAPPLAFTRWAWRTLNDVFSSFGAEAFRTNGGLGYAWPQLFAVTTLLGLGRFGRARRTDGLILLGPLAVALVASLLRLYPLSGRLLVFLIPLLLLATAAGAQTLWAWTAARGRLAALALVAAFVAIPVHAAVKSRPPYLIQPLRPVLERVEGQRQPNDAIYVDYAAAQAFRYYAPRFGFDPAQYVIGRCAVFDRRDYLRQIDQFRGRRRVWIIGTHLSAVERSLTVGYLEQIGRRVASVFIPPAGAPLRFAAYARLYDLSDTRRLASATASTFTIRDVPLPVGVKEWGCAGPLSSAE